jgi:hypothetical protein
MRRRIIPVCRVIRLSETHSISSVLEREVVFNDRLSTRDPSQAVRSFDHGGAGASDQTRTLSSASRYMKASNSVKKHSGSILKSLTWSPGDIVSSVAAWINRCSALASRSIFGRRYQELRVDPCVGRRIFLEPAPAAWTRPRQRDRHHGLPRYPVPRRNTSTCSIKARVSG